MAHASLRFYDKSKIDKSNVLFKNSDLRTLLIPIMIEQFLNSFIGMADTMMVSQVGSAAISAVSLVDSINVLVIQVFAALASGGAIICAQYLGRKDAAGSSRAAKQVTLAVAAISVSLMILCMVFCHPLLWLIFGKVELDVMEASVLYFWITAASFPFIALFNAGSAFYRAGGESRFPMLVSVASNVLNIFGNAVFIFGCGMGVAGAALSTLLARFFCAVVLFYGLRRPRQPIVISGYLKIRPDLPLITTVLKIGIPTGIENGMFQFGKLAIQSSVSTLGTAAIAAQAMTSILENVSVVAAMSIGIGLMTVVGQCMGAGRVEEARYYIVKLTAVSEAVIIVSSLLVLAATKPVLFLAGMEAESARLCFEMTVFITIVRPVSWVLSFIPPYGMRAAGDVRFSMLLSTVSMWGCRVFLAVYLIRMQGFGPIAVWIGMFADWVIRSIAFTIRFFSGKWTRFHVI